MFMSKSHINITLNFGNVDGKESTFHRKRREVRSLELKHDIE